MKILRKLCSQQVQVLLERMDNHWDDEFYLDDTKWSPVLPGGNVFKYFTKIEQKCIRDAVEKHTLNCKKERAYSTILERAMSPAKTRWEYNREKEGEHVGIQAQEVAKPSKILTPGLMAQQAQQVLEQEYKKAYAAQNQAQNPYKGTLAQHAQYEQAEALRRAMQNVQFELNQARNADDVAYVYAKYDMMIRMEKNMIEHQQFLKQFAPRGY